MTYISAKPARQDAESLPANDNQRATRTDLSFLDVINVTGASSSDDVEFDYRRGVVVRDKNSAEPLIGLRFDYAW